MEKGKIYVELNFQPEIFIRVTWECEKNSIIGMKFFLIGSSDAPRIEFNHARVEK